jgi:hypothetical protein
VKREPVVDLFESVCFVAVLDAVAVEVGLHRVTGDGGFFHGDTTSHVRDAPAPTHDREHRWASIDAIVCHDGSIYRASSAAYIDGERYRMRPLQPTLTLSAPRRYG